MNTSHRHLIGRTLTASTGHYPPNGTAHCGRIDIHLLAATNSIIAVTDPPADLR